MPRPTTPLLSRTGIRDCALTIIDRDGLDGLSMRKLAAALGVSAPALYFHFPTKEQLLDDVASAIMEKVDVSAFTHGWREGLLTWARSYRAALAEHPNIVPFLARGPGQRDASLRRADTIHGGLVAAGWHPRDATMIGASTKYLVLGAAMGSFSRGFTDDVQVYLDRYPALGDAHRLRENADTVDRDSFDFALTMFVDGLTSRLSQRL
ncbi:TetR/AcrR family transcriptional regulator [Actinoplanes derwentensis]|uniref:Tetracyclin repressor, C-terminal all-alpha domain n=1 Tax=Actinoplanes derwentensis TaxID=113562 RepID=A0A1H2AFS4_9ACTN|nr:TetR family transcriptional regulator [Actinoplanes derwentensis]GID88247.1 TetR family transcriptional regulator [Actinoplanes derwentensis]SDT44622.1 Tetracyclin repressor, C-terminal all-alpha domain [Actinoplanes derwentensis]